MSLERCISLFLVAIIKKLTSLCPDAANDAFYLQAAHKPIEAKCYTSMPHGHNTFKTISRLCKTAGIEELKIQCELSM